LKVAVSRGEATTSAAECWGSTCQPVPSCRSNPKLPFVRQVHWKSRRSQTTLPPLSGRPLRIPLRRTRKLYRACVNRSPPHRDEVRSSSRPFLENPQLRQPPLFH